MTEPTDADYPPARAPPIHKAIAILAHHRRGPLVIAIISAAVTVVFGRVMDWGQAFVVWIWNHVEFVLSVGWKK